MLEQCYNGGRGQNTSLLSHGARSVYEKGYYERGCTLGQWKIFQFCVPLPVSNVFAPLHINDGRQLQPHSRDCTLTASGSEKFLPQPFGEYEIQEPNFINYTHIYVSVA